MGTSPDLSLFKKERPIVIEKADEYDLRAILSLYQTIAATAQAPADNLTRQQLAVRTMNALALDLRHASENTIKVARERGKLQGFCVSHKQAWEADEHFIVARDDIAIALKLLELSVKWDNPTTDARVLLMALSDSVASAFDSLGLEPVSVQPEFSQGRHWQIPASCKGKILTRLRSQLPTGAGS